MAYIEDRKYFKNLIAMLLRKYAERSTNDTCEDIELEMNTVTMSIAEQTETPIGNNDTITFKISTLAEYMADMIETDANGG
jgi:hypothetical protein